MHVCARSNGLAEQIHLFFSSGLSRYQPISHKQRDVFQNLNLVHPQTSGDVVDRAGTACQKSKDVFAAC